MAAKTDEIKQLSLMKYTKTIVYLHIYFWFARFDVVTRHFYDSRFLRRFRAKTHPHRVFAFSVNITGKRFLKKNPTS